ncbi:MAG: hemolysin III family protein [Oscillospiraceae bacterium]|nr:hemolysin III family protein [Oscillospiraceae bacterium]
MATVSKTQNKVKFYTLGEEITNSITHGIGALLGVAGLVILLVFSNNAWEAVSSSIYGASMIMLFTMSTLYHALSNEKAKKVFRIFDHTSIFFLIAGTYTPITLVLLNGALGWVLFGIVWAAAIVGIVLNSISIERFKKFSMICYIASGWCIVIAIYPLIKAIATGGLVLLVLGGVAYTLGIIFYKKKTVRYMHAIWHIFVLLGAILQYFSILKYVIMA